MILYEKTTYKFLNGVTKVKDIFNGNIKHEYIGQAISAIIVLPIVTLICGIFFLCIALFYAKVEESARILLFVLSGIAFFLTVGYPLATVYFVNRQDKYPRIARLLLKKYLFASNKIEQCKHNTRL
jgi:hypothetical protein